METKPRRPPLMLQEVISGPAQRPAFLESHVRARSAASPRLRRALALRQELAALQAAASVLDRLHFGVILFTAAGHAMYGNHAAQSILRSAEGLSLQDGSLTAADRRTHALLQRAIHCAARLDRSWPYDALLVHRKSLRRPYQVLVSPVRRQSPRYPAPDAPAVLVLIADPDLDSSAPAHLMRRLYGLTLKESELAARLSVGASLRQAAAELRMSYETARTHLKRICGKTGVSRQSQLAALIARLPHMPLA